MGQPTHAQAPSGHEPGSQPRATRRRALIVFVALSVLGLGSLAWVQVRSSSELYGAPRPTAVLEPSHGDVAQGPDGWLLASGDPRSGADPERLLEVNPPRGWRPEPGAPLDEVLPYPWPDKYTEIYEQAFAPFSFAKNASALCGHIDEAPADIEAVQQVARSLVDRLEQHSVDWKDGALVRYSFPHEYRDELLPAGWVSAYANARVIQGLVHLGRCLGDGSYTRLAYRYFAPLSRDSPVTFVSPEGWVWFEEAPLPGGRAAMVLNGHLTSVAALYYLYEWGGRDSDVLTSWRAGVASAKQFVSAFRREGAVNRYDLMEPPVDDYGPQRTIRQQRAMFEMTGDQFFARWARTFEADLAARG